VSWVLVGLEENVAQQVPLVHKVNEAHKGLKERGVRKVLRVHVGHKVHLESTPASSYRSAERREMTDPDALDGCDLDFKEVPPTTVQEVDEQLVPEGEEEDVEDD